MLTGPGRFENVSLNSELQPPPPVLPGNYSLNEIVDVLEVAALPGFARGLALSGQYTFIGLSKMRAISTLDGVTPAERRGELNVAWLA